MISNVPQVCFPAEFQSSALIGHVWSLSPSNPRAPSAGQYCAPEQRHAIGADPIIGQLSKTTTNKIKRINTLVRLGFAIERRKFKRKMAFEKENAQIATRIEPDLSEIMSPRNGF